MQLIKESALRTIRLYQSAVSPYMPAACRHSPTCSEYAHEAITKYGLPRGTWLTAKRLGRCRPMGTRGYDPVP